MSEFRNNEKLSNHTNYKIGGEASHFILLNPESNLKEVSTFIKENKLPYFILGLGSNCLVPDEKIDAIILKFDRRDTLIDWDADFIYTSAGTPISSLLIEAKKQGWDGFEKLAGIPANVGGAVFMNAGTHLGDVSDLISKVEVYNLKDETFQEIEVERDDFAYRENLFLKDHDLITGVYWKLVKATPLEVARKQKEILVRRKATQPLQSPSCGSVFKNPKEMPAWKVIDELGLRGKQIGGAQISEMHSNWILNTGGATQGDVLSLMDSIELQANQTLGINLEREVRLLELKNLN